MIQTISSKTNFTAGILSSNLYGRGDLSIYENGAKTLDNVIIHPTGGVSRRKGTEFVDKIEGVGKLVPFEFNTNQIYLLCFMDKKLNVYKNDQIISCLETPWSVEQLNNINYTQSADTLIIVHPDVKPMKITRNKQEVWKVEEWNYYENEGFIYCPYFNFYDNKIEVSISNTSITTKEDLFTSNYLGMKIKSGKGLAEIVEIESTKKVNIKILKAFNNYPLVTKNWEEQAFSESRGYPTTVCFHQDRMVIGGSRSLPNRLWFSKSSDLFNFDLGTGLDDEGIEFAILSNKINKITNIVSSRHLLIFTTGAEWMLSGDVLTPTNISLNIQTTTGNYDKYNITPSHINGATVFLSRDGKTLKEFLYTDVEQAYSSKDLTLLSNNLTSPPICSDFNPEENVLYMGSEDGTVSCLTSYRTEDVNAWSKLTTDGKFVSLCLVGSDMYFIISRNNGIFIEKFSDSFFSDCSKEFNSTELKTKWDELHIYEGQTVSIIGDGYILGKYIVENGEINLFDAVKNIKIGLPYRHIIEPLPYMIDDIRPYPPKAIKPINTTFRIINSQSFDLEIGKKNKSIPLKKIYKDEILDSVPNIFSGDVSVGSLRWIRDLKESLWKISSDEAVSFTLLSSTMKLIIKR